MGENNSGEIGNGTRNTQTLPVKVLEDVDEFAGGWSISSALTKGGDLYCWGWNSDGQVGNGTKEMQLTPYKTLDNIKKYYILEVTMLLLQKNGDLYCWGDNGYGQVGNGTYNDQLTPYKVIFPKDTSIDSSVTLKTTAKAVNAFLKDVKGPKMGRW